MSEYRVAFDFNEEMQAVRFRHICMKLIREDTAFLKVLTGTLFTEFQELME